MQLRTTSVKIAEIIKARFNKIEWNFRKWDIKTAIKTTSSSKKEIKFIKSVIGTSSKIEINNDWKVMFIRWV